MRQDKMFHDRQILVLDSGCWAAMVLVASDTHRESESKLCDCWAFIYYYYSSTYVYSGNKSMFISDFAEARQILDQSLDESAKSHQ